MADRYGIYCASFTHAGGTLDLQQLDSQGLSAGAQRKTIRPGGAINPAAHILSTANPTARFSTCDCASLMTVLGSNFHLYCSGGHVMRYQKRDEGGTFKAGLDHFTQSTAKGFLHVASIDVDIDSQDGARFELEYIPLSVAGENPITNNTGVSFGAVAAPAFGSQFFLGGMWIDAAQSLGLTRLRIVPGNRFVTRRSDGGVFPRADGSSIVARDPMFVFNYLNVTLPATITSFFLSALGGQIKTYLQRGTTAVDGRIAAATTSHWRCTAATGSWGAEELSVGGEDDGSISVFVAPTGAITPTLNVALGA